MPRPSQRSANVCYYRRNRSLEIDRVRARQRGTVDLLRQLREQPCADCGGRFAAHVMDFDHLDPHDKAFRLTAGGAMLRPTAVLLAEAAKCEIVCANCHRVRTRRRAAAQRTESTGSSRYLERKRESWRAHARLLDQLRDRPCTDCGGRFEPCAMDFDHRDPRSKRSAVTRLIGRAGIETILEEAAKCDIVCANCHRLRTFLRRSTESARE
jgi:formate-dependent nitrite reductase cytochrome c552 subunit